MALHETPSAKFTHTVGRTMEVHRSRPNHPGGTFNITEVVELPAAYGLGTLVRFRSGERVIFEGYTDTISERPSGAKIEIVLTSQAGEKRKNLKNRTYIR